MQNLEGYFWQRHHYVEKPLRLRSLGNLQVLSEGMPLAKAVTPKVLFIM